MSAATAKPRVSADGVVTLDGTVIGSLKREERQGLYATALGVSASSGTVVWTPLDTNGDPLVDAPYPTRKRAVERLVKHAQPLTVTDVERLDDFANGLPLFAATVSWQGYTAMVSHYPYEGEWIVDCFFTPDSLMPKFSNGKGTRVTRGRTLPKDKNDAVTAAVREAGLL